MIVWRPRHLSPVSRNCCQDFFLYSGWRFISKGNTHSPWCKVIKVSLTEHKYKHLVFSCSFVRNGQKMSPRIYHHFVNNSVALARGGQLPPTSLGGGTWKTPSDKVQFFVFQQSRPTHLYLVWQIMQLLLHPWWHEVKFLLCGNNLTSNLLVEQQPFPFGCLCFAK